jgi:hypothetical protein
MVSLSPGAAAAISFSRDSLVHPEWIVAGVDDTQKYAIEKKMMG